MTAPFIASLFDLLGKAEFISMDGCEVDDDSLEHVVKEGSPGTYIVDYGYAADYTFHDQQVVCTPNGYVDATSTVGVTHRFVFCMSHPITKEDLE